MDVFWWFLLPFSRQDGPGQTPKFLSILYNVLSKQSILWAISIPVSDLWDAIMT
jgi:hypothetical protein